MKQMQEAHGCRVHVQRREECGPTDERTVDIEGTEDSRNRCLADILEVVDWAKGPDGRVYKEPRGPRGSQSENSRTIVLMIDADDMGRVIGRGGSTIADIQRMTGCDINADKSHSAQRWIEVSGEPEQIERAKAAIFPLVHWVKDKEGNYIKEPGSGNPVGDGRGGGRNSGSSANLMPIVPAQMMGMPGHQPPPPPPGAFPRPPSVMPSMPREGGRGFGSNGVSAVPFGKCPEEHWVLDPKLEIDYSDL